MLLEMLLNEDVYEIELSSKKDFFHASQTALRFIENSCKELNNSHMVNFLLLIIEAINTLESDIVHDAFVRGEKLDELSDYWQAILKRVSIERDIYWRYLNKLFFNSHIEWIGKLNINIKLLASDSAIKDPEKFFINDKSYLADKDFQVFLNTGSIDGFPFYLYEILIYQNHVDNSETPVYHEKIRKKLRNIKVLYMIYHTTQTLLHISLIPKIKVTFNDGELITQSIIDKGIIDEMKKKDTFIKWNVGGITNISEASKLFTELETEAFKTREKKGKNNLKVLSEIRREQLKNIPQINNIINKKYSTTRNIFETITNALYRIIYYSKPNTVLIIKFKELHKQFENLDALKGTSQEDIKKIIASLGFLSDNYFYCVHSVFTLKFRNLCHFFTLSSHKRYVGNKMEKFVSELLENEDFCILEHNLPILSKFMPKNVSERLYQGFIKQRTEVDIIIKYKNIILLISIKYREARKKIDFNVLSEELYYVTRWYLQQNQNHLVGVPIITSNLVELKKPLTHAFYIPIGRLQRDLLSLSNNIIQLYKRQTQVICCPKLEIISFDPV